MGGDGSIAGYVSLVRLRIITVRSRCRAILSMFFILKFKLGEVH